MHEENSAKISTIHIIEKQEDIEMELFLIICALILFGSAIEVPEDIMEIQHNHDE